MSFKLFNGCCLLFAVGPFYLLPAPPETVLLSALGSSVYLHENYEYRK